jgi:alpha/beta superfamily hydrolase
VVTRGQFLERPTLIPVGRDVLEGLSHRGVRAPSLLVLPPAPGRGGDMQHVVAAELAWAATRAGHATLRFNFRGVGASQGRRGSAEEQLADAAAALQLLADNSGASAFVVASLPGSEGTAFSLADSRRDVRALVLVCPTALDTAAIRRAARPLRVIVGALDGWQPDEHVRAALTQVGGELDLVEHADQRFLRNLPQVGRGVVALMAEVQA